MTTIHRLPSVQLLPFFSFFILLFFSTTFSYSQSQEKVDSLLHVLETTSSEKVRIKTNIKLSSSHASIDAKKGVKYANSAIKLAKKIGDKKLQANAYQALGINWFIQSKYDKALNSFTRSKELYLEIGEISKAGGAIGNIANIWTTKGDFTNALKYRFEELKLLDPQEDAIAVFGSHMSIGVIFYRLEKYSEALKHDSIALEGFTRIKDKVGIADCKGSMANVYLKQGKTELAKENYSAAIAIYETMNYHFNLIGEFINLSAVYELEGNFYTAIELTQKALNLSKKYEYPLGYGACSVNIGSYYFSIFKKHTSNTKNQNLQPFSTTQLLDSAIYYLEQCLSLGIGVNGALTTVEAKQKLSEAQFENGQLTEAYYNFKSAIELTDSINSSETKKEIETLITEREIAVKDKQIELDKLAIAKKRNERFYFGAGLFLMLLLLIAVFKIYRNQKRSNIQLSSTNKDLSSTLKQLHSTQEQLIDVERQKQKALIRTRISQDIHDDISSNLTKISWLSELIESKVNQTMKNDVSELAKKINKSSSNTVSQLSEIIWSTNPEADNITSLLSYMRSHVNSFLEDSDIDYSIRFPEESFNQKVSPELRHNLFLILKEAVNNAFKYSKADSLKIDFTLNGDHYELSIADNGVGFDQDEVIENGNGLKNISKRVNKIGGTLLINSQHGKGTVIKCTGNINL